MALLLSEPRSIPLPRLRREGIRWRTVAPGTVEIAIEVANPTDRPTEPDVLVVEAAPLGAFLPFEPIARQPVDSLAPGERKWVSVHVARSVLDRFNLDEEMCSIFEAVCQSEWAGNLNVWFDRAPDQAVERHQARGLQIRAGGKMHLLFLLPPDTGEFRIEAAWNRPGWSARVYGHLGEVRNRASFRHGSDFGLLLVEAPRQVGAQATVETRVTRSRDGKMVPVEFSFTSVDGASSRLGCTKVQR